MRGITVRFLGRLFTMQSTRKGEAILGAFYVEDEICKGQVQLSLGYTSVLGGDNDRQQNVTPISESCRESFAARARARAAPAPRPPSTSDVRM